MDEIRIDNLEVFAHHGVFEEENVKGQHFYVNAILYTQTRKAGISDCLEESTHYGLVCHTITEFMQKNTFRLIETVAEGVAREVLRTYPLVEKISVEIRKPEAPIGLPFASVSVKIMRGWHTSYLALGSNMGDKEKYLQFALEKIAESEDCKVEKVSGFLETEPYGGVEQDSFLNAAMKVKTLLLPEELLIYLQGIEMEAGRERLVRWGPRTLDLDILLYEEIQMTSETLTIPHIDMANRSFVLMPLAEIASYEIHPGNGKTIARMLADLL